MLLSASEVQFVPATSDDTALPLFWEDTTVSIPGPFLSDGSQPNVDAPVMGLKNLVPDLSNDPKWVGYIVADNKVIKTDQDNVVMSDVTIADTVTGGTRITTSKPVEGFHLTLMCPALYKIDGGYKDAQVVVGIFYRVKDSTGPWRTVNSKFVISGKQRSEILRTVKVDHCKDGYNYYDILVVRVTEEHTGDSAFDYADDVYIKDLTEINYSSIAYNHTALMGVKIRATDQLSGQPPAVTCIVKGTKVAIPSNLVAAYATKYDEDGNYNFAPVVAAYEGVMGSLTWGEQEKVGEKYWTDNPVWCLYDLLTNTRYGLGNYYKISPDKRGLMLANFYLMAKYCDQEIKYTDASGVNSINKYRPRFSLNMVIDQSKSASEWISQICAIMRASVYYTEGIFWIDIDRPKLMSQIFNMTNISEYSQTATSFREIPNSYEVQWINPDTDYEIDSFKLEDLDLQMDATLEERKKALTLVGVTNFDAAKSLARYALLTGKYCTKMVTFKTGTDGLRSMVGDIVGIQHDVPLWGWGGQIVSYDQSTLKVTLSSPIIPEADTEYVFSAALPSTLVGTTPAPIVADPSWEGETEVWEITLPSGTPFGDYPALAPGVKYVIGTTEASINPFKLVSIKRAEDDLCEITAIEYHEEIYPLCDDASSIAVFDPKDYSLLPDTRRVSVSNVHAELKMYKDLGGNEKVGVEVFYTKPKATFWKNAQLYWAKVGTTNYSTMPPNNTGYFLVDNITEEGEYIFIVTSIYTNGKQTVSDALADKENHPWDTLEVTPYLNNDVFYEGVTGLAIENKANDGTFIGKDCILVWHKPAATVAQTNTTTAGSTAAGTSAGTTWSGDYEVMITGKDSSVKRKTRITSERFTYTHEMNYADAVDGDADRLFTCTVTAYDKLGRKSKPKSIDCYNPAPKKISVL